VSTPTLPTYETPPVVEVVCGVTFDPVPGFTVPLVGKLWRDHLPDFKVEGEQPPLAPQFEVLERGGVTFSFDPNLPMPRVWFVNDRSNQLIQIQRDRFLCNWRKTETDHEYPRFAKVSGFFKQQIAVFESFIRENCDRELVPRQYELTYLNHLAAETRASARAGNIGRLLPDFAWRNASAGRWLPDPEDVDLNLAFLLPNEAGRLRVKVQTAQLARERTRVILLDLTARGFSGNRDEWFDVAHTWIVKGFEDLASPAAENIWGKR
jgi:uncharacterized protein (TIGR04255 family)